MASRSRSVLLTAALAVVAHLVLLFAPLTCACGDAAGEPAMTACCCKPGDPPMPCSSGGSDAAPGPGGCASARATCVAEIPDGVAASVAPSVTLPTFVLSEPAAIAASLEPPALLRRDLDTGPPPPRLALVLTRCSVMRV